MKILLFILFASTATALGHSRDPVANYDITSLLNDSIARTFQNLNSAVIADLLIFKLDNANPINYVVEVDYDLEPFRNKFYFTRVNISIDLVSKSFPVRHEFSSFETAISIPKLEFAIEGYLGATDDTVHARFVCYVHFKNVSIITYKISPDVPVESKLYFDMKYDENFECDFLRLTWFHENLTSEARFKLKQKIRKAVPLLFLENLQHNERFSQSLDTKLCNHPEKEIASLYPDFQNNSERYHYFIPNITSLNRTLSNITIAGLWNFQSHSVNVLFGHVVRNLTIKNIRGQANLTYDSQLGSEIFSSLFLSYFPEPVIFPLRFEVGFVSILVDEEMQRVSVTTYNYSVSQIDLNRSLTEHQSKWVMGGVELAIASSIMPSIKFYRNTNLSSNTLEEHPLVKMSATISHVFHANSIQELYHDLNISLSKETTVESNVQLGAFNYNISINYTSRSSPAALLHTDYFDCAFYSTFRMFSKLPWSGHANIRLGNSTHRFEDFGFLTSEKVHIMFTTRNNLNDSDDYDISVGPNFMNPDADDSKLLDERNNFTENQARVIREKATQMLCSTILDRFLISAKRFFSSSQILHYCSAPLKMFDDFLPFFANHELPYYIHIDDAGSNTTELQVIITEWTKCFMPWIRYEKDDNGNIVSEVLIRLQQAKIKMSFNDISFPSNDLELEFKGISLRNQTNTGNLVATLGYPSENYFSLLRNKKVGLKEICEYLIKESFKKCTKQGNDRYK